MSFLFSLTRALKSQTVHQSLFLLAKATAGQAAAARGGLAFI
jgi:hypothetical protein